MAAATIGSKTEQTISNFDNKEQESIWVRGLAAALQAMHMPTEDNLRYLLDKMGYKLIKK